MIATNEYKKSNDLVSEFIGVSLVREDGAFSKVGDVHGVFNVWFKENYPDGKIFSRKEFLRLASKTMGNISNGRGGTQGWAGWKIVEVDDDDVM